MFAGLARIFVGALAAGVMIGSSGCDAAEQVYIVPSFGSVPSASDVADAIGDCLKVVPDQTTKGDPESLVQKNWASLAGSDNPNPRTIHSYRSFRKGAFVLALSEFDSMTSCTLFFAAPSTDRLDQFLADISASSGMTWLVEGANDLGPETVGYFAATTHNVMVQRKTLDGKPILVLTSVPRDR